MYRWLKPQAQAPLLGALIFVVAPYHAYNLYARGAIAETVATAIIPFVMIGVRKLAIAERGGFVIAALAYAALIMSHLPLALLASIFLIGPYSLLQSWKAPDRLARIAASLAMGIALAAAYLVPALLLEPFRDTAKLWHRTVLKPSNWSFWNPEFRSWQNYVSIAVIGAALALPLAWLARRGGPSWALFGLVCVALAIGTVPAFWNLPLLVSVQFPFRLLPIAEFALATALAMTAVRPVTRIVVWAIILTITIPITRATNPPAVSLAELKALHPDVPENLPAGERPYSWPSRWALQVAANHRQPRHLDGTTVLPIFQYPAWEVRCDGAAVRTFADPETKLLSYKGTRNCDVKLTTTPPEKLGLAISFLALASLLLGTAFVRFHSRAAGSTSKPAEG